MLYQIKPYFVGSAGKRVHTKQIQVLELLQLCVSQHFLTCACCFAFQPQQAACSDWILETTINSPVFQAL